MEYFNQILHYGVRAHPTFITSQLLLYIRRQVQLRTLRKPHVYEPWEILFTKLRIQNGYLKTFQRFKLLWFWKKKL